MRPPFILFAMACGVAAGTGCSSSPDSPSAAPSDDGGSAHDSSAPVDARATTDARPPADAPIDHLAPEAAASCSTRITYGGAWIHGANHPGQEDTALADVTWDGVCVDDGPNSYAMLSNGWKPYFQANGACILALDYQGPCAHGGPCTTRVSYGAAWLAPPNHPATFDDVAGRVFSDGICHDTGGQSYADLSNGWAPHFGGNGACRLSFAYTQCGGLYTNPVIPLDCPDPGVLHDGNQYVLTCTSGGAPNAYPIYTSPDLATWTPAGHIFPSAKKPAWATGDFWAPEIHKVGTHYVAYFSARNVDGRLSIGAASAATALGPFTDIGQPLIHDPGMGLIDASEINANGAAYVLWKEDGNAVGQSTPIHAQPLAADGLSLTGARSTLITNDQAWEGPVTEGPFMVEHAGSFFLFYSGNAYNNGTYAVGVARASSPLGPFAKAGGPIVVTGGAWVGPGHCSVVDAPGGETAMVYHAWPSGCVAGPGCGRMVLTDLVAWGGGFPGVPLAPSSTTRPLP